MDKWRKGFLVALIILLVVIVPIGCIMTSLNMTPTWNTNPAWSPDGSKIAYIAESSIYLMDIDGSNKTKLCGGSSFTWSPDGSKITFYSGGDIYAINADGSNQTKIATGSSPCWSPDGTRIAFVRQLNDIYVVDASEANLEQLTNLQASATALGGWSPDGSKITFYSGGDIYAINADGSNQTKLTDDGSSPRWSPEGSKIAFTHSSSLYLMDIDGSNKIELIDGINGAPVWSPDGGKIAYLSDSVIYTIDADGSNQFRLTKPTLGSVITGDTDRVRYSHFGWSPDGSKIVCQRVENKGKNFSDITVLLNEIYVIDADGSNLTKLTSIDE